MNVERALSNPFAAATPPVVNYWRNPLQRAHEAASRFVHEYESHGDEGLFVSHFLELTTSLFELHESCSPEVWKEHVFALRRHPVQELLQQDPFTHRAFTRPRGYAGDAVTIDMLYEILDVRAMPEVSPLGKAVWALVAGSGAVQAVRTRRAIVARYLERTFATSASPAILSVACGHMRELSLCRNYEPTTSSLKLHALDHDADSLDEVARMHPELRPNMLHMNALRLAKEGVRLPPMDFVVSAGLYDYLKQDIAQRLTRHLFECVRPGGTLLLANFMPANAIRGYMEVFMNWPLVHRSLGEIADLARTIPKADVAECRVFSDLHGAVGYIELTRA